MPRPSGYPVSHFPGEMVRVARDGHRHFPRVTMIEGVLKTGSRHRERLHIQSAILPQLSDAAHRIGLSTCLNCFLLLRFRCSLGRASCCEPRPRIHFRLVGARGCLTHCTLFHLIPYLGSTITYCYKGQTSTLAMSCLVLYFLQGFVPLQVSKLRGELFRFRGAEAPKPREVSTEAAIMPEDNTTN